jgi:hypothetical protein
VKFVGWQSDWVMGSFEVGIRIVASCVGRNNLGKTEKWLALCFRRGLRLIALRLNDEGKLQPSKLL